jgi:hypothetical protein
MAEQSPLRQLQRSAASLGRYIQFMEFGKIKFSSNREIHSPSPEPKQPLMPALRKLVPERAPPIIAALARWT